MLRLARVLLTFLTLAIAASASGMRAPVLEQETAIHLALVSHSIETCATPITDTRLSYEKVSDVFSSNKLQTLVHITLNNGETIQATEGHPFKTTDGWRDAILLKKGGKLLLKASDGEDLGKTSLITEIRIEQKVLPVFNLEVANAHTFFVGTDGELVHNAIHHICTKYGDRGGRMDQTLKKAGFPKGVEDARNKVDVAGHYGPHPSSYHDAVEKGLNAAAEKGTKAVEDFLKKMGNAASTVGTSVNDALTKKRGR
jgi:hypothetical protein